ncbi:MAG: transcriptional repressor [Oscillospiraceae bacterium]|nr:transcriptional repressor [Oscillospiraceae bacterium]
MKTRKHSRKREAILQNLRATTAHPSADRVFQDLRGEYPDLSLATVYRNLLLFKEEGVIQSVGTVSGQERFDGQTTPHGHFVCRGCGDVSDIQVSPDKLAMVVPIDQMGGCQIDRIDCTVYGICPNCLKAG